LQRVAASHAALEAQTFDRGDLAVLRLGGQGQAGQYGLAVDLDGARTTVALVAALFAADEVELVAEDFEQGPMRRRRHLGGFAVDAQSQKPGLRHGF
jgi:hypothetical protein